MLRDIRFRQLRYIVLQISNLEGTSPAFGLGSLKLAYRINDGALLKYQELAWLAQSVERGTGVEAGPLRGRLNFFASC